MSRSSLQRAQVDYESVSDVTLQRALVSFIDFLYINDLNILNDSSLRDSLNQFYVHLSRKANLTEMTTGEFL